MFNYGASYLDFDGGVPLGGCPATRFHVAIVVISFVVFNGIDKIHRLLCIAGTGFHPEVAHLFTRLDVEDKDRQGAKDQVKQRII